jgi:hypothetical protein
MNRPGVTDRDFGGIFLAACILSGGKSRRPVALPFWSAPEIRHHRRELQTGLRWLAEFLDTVAAAAKAGLDELQRLRRAEEISRSLGRTARSRLPDAADAMLRAHSHRHQFGRIDSRHATSGARPFATIDGKWSGSGGNRARILAGLRIDLKGLWFVTNPH